MRGGIHMAKITGGIPAPRRKNKNLHKGKIFMDYMVRATAADGYIRAFASTTKELVEKARTIHGTTPVVTAALGRLLTAGAMMGLMMKGDKDILTIMVRGDGPIGSLTVTADSKGNVKGYPDNAAVIIPLKSKAKLDVGGAVGAGTLTVIKDLGLKEPYTGQVELVSGEIAEDITYYFAASEQVPSSVGLGVLVDTDMAVKQAGGFIVQLMPGTPDEVIDVLEKRLAGLKSVTGMLEDNMTPEEIINMIFEGLDPEILDKTELSFKCNCSYDRMAKALISIGEKELTAIINDGEPAELKCHFCGSTYEFSIEDLKELLELAKQ